MATKPNNNLFLMCGMFIVVAVFASVSAFAQSSGALEEYKRVLQLGSSDEKRTVLFTLRNFESQEAANLAVVAIRDPDEMVRATAAGTLIFSSNPGANITPLLSDRAPFVRKEAAYALGKARVTNAATRLSDMLLHDDNYEVRSACAVALGTTGTPFNVEALSKAIRINKGNRKTFLRRAAARSIGQIAQNAQHQIFSETTPRSFLPEEYKPKNIPEYKNLVETFPQFNSALSVLFSMVDNKNTQEDELREAVFALGEIGNEATLAKIARFRLSADPYLREIALEAFRKVNETAESQ
ncbi:MAG: HEAT repeat domain-containing protein [Pyrinomonadaceae bacterium]